MADGVAILKAEWSCWRSRCVFSYATGYLSFVQDKPLSITAPRTARLEIAWLVQEEPLEAPDAEVLEVLLVVFVVVVDGDGGARCMRQLW